MAKLLINQLLKNEEFTLWLIRCNKVSDVYDDKFFKKIKNKVAKNDLAILQDDDRTRIIYFDDKESLTPIRIL